MPSFRRAVAVPLVLSAFGLLAACASAGAGEAGLRGAEPVAQVRDDPAAVDGLFLAGRAAIDDGHGRAASEFFERAARADPDALLKDRAFTAALFAGEVHRAAALAPSGDEGSVSMQQLGRATQATDLIALGRYREALALLGGDPIGPHRAVLALLGPWAAAGAGDWKTALTLPNAHGDRLVDGLSRLDEAMLYERAGRMDDADAAFRNLVAESGGLALYTTRYGDFLERRGRRKDAEALYANALKAGGPNSAYSAALQRVQAGGPAPAAPTIAQGAGRALLGPAAQLLAEKQPELGVAYLWLVLRLDPGRDEAWLLAGDAMAMAGDNDEARRAFGQVSATSPDYVEARSRLIATFQGAADSGTALKLARETAQAAPTSDEAQLLLADCLRAARQFAESAQVLDGVVARSGDHADWQVYYMRGVALAEGGRWPEGEKDLQRAMSMQPGQPDILNYLGYSWIEHGEHLPQARAMLAQAVAAKPDSGSMLDSLGWADYQLGDIDQAIDKLEQAVALEPVEPEIIDHLGDAYWRAGRKTEARYQWERVLGLNPSVKLKNAVDAKLRSQTEIAPRKVAGR
jgi:tetratricopeptide (TPR) repeat protein